MLCLISMGHPSHVGCGQSYPVLAFYARLLVNIISEHFCLRTNSYAVTNLPDAHFLQHLLIHVHQVLAVDVVLPEHIHILPAVDAPEPLAHASLVPILHRLCCTVTI